MFEKPTTPIPGDRPEFDVLGLTAEEATPQNVLRAIHVAMSTVASWGRNSDELPELQRLFETVQRAPTNDNCKKALAYIQNLLENKQDYN